MSVPYLSLVRLPVRPSWYFLYGESEASDKNRRSHMTIGLTGVFLEHFWYGESISELHLASIPWEHLHFASRVQRDFRPVEVVYVRVCTYSLVNQKKTDLAARIIHMKWTSQIHILHDPTITLGQLGCGCWGRGWARVPQCAYFAKVRKFGRVSPAG